jgi:hypothetical protein
MSIIRQVVLDRATRKKDKSVALTFITDLEQSTDEFMEIDKQLMKHGILYFSERTELTQQEVDELDNVDIEIEGKTKSQRLRSVLYVYWKQQASDKDFKTFYSDWMEQVITKMKNKLEL